MPNVPGVGQTLEQPYYDTILLAAAATGGTFFVNPFGSAIGATTKGYQHTNFIQAGRLETGYELTVDAVSLHIVEWSTRASEVDIQSFQSGYFQLLISETQMLTVPIALIPDGGAELQMFSNITPAATEYQLNKGNPVTQNRFYLREPIVLNPQQSIKATVGGFHTAIVAATYVCATLWGIVKRPVV